MGKLNERHTCVRLEEWERIGGDFYLNYIKYSKMNKHKISGFLHLTLPNFEIKINLFSLFTLT